MSGLQLQINRLEISLHGISAQLVEQAVGGLEETLRRRLQGMTLGARHGLDMAQLTLAPLQVGSDIDVAGLRALLVEQIEYAVLRAAGDRSGRAPGPEQGGWV
jgi:hypothetical protein